MAGVEANREIVLGAVARLTATQRAAIGHSYYEAWTIAQIADDPTPTTEPLSTATVMGPL